MSPYGSGPFPFGIPYVDFGEKRKMLNIRPINDKILIEPVQQSNQTPGGIYVPEGAIEPMQKAKVVALGNGKILADGTRIEFTVQIDDNILYSKYGGTEVSHEGTKYLLITEDNILAILD